MQHPTLFSIFLCLHCLLFVASYTSERLARADAVGCASCGSTPKHFSIPPKLEARNVLSLEKNTKQHSGKTADTEAKPSLEKQKRQVNTIDTTYMHQPIMPNDVDRFRCKMGHVRRTKCNIKQCKESGGRCQRMILNGQERCNQTQLLQNGDLVPVWWQRDLPSCRRCRCVMDSEGRQDPRRILNHLGV
jgi:hypothetical protein